MALILVVDDNNSVREVLRMMLARGSHRVLGAPLAEEALKLLETQPVELALIDIEMPGMNGYELCERLRQHPKWAHLPIALMTGRVVTGTLEKALMAGAQRMIAKPFTRAELFAVVQQLLAGETA